MSATPIAIASADCAASAAATVGEIFDLTADFSGWLEAGDAISSAVWSAPVGIGLSSPTTTATTATVRVSLVAAEASRDYWLRVRIVTQIGLAETKSIRLSVRSCAPGKDEPGPYPQTERLPG